MTTTINAKNLTLSEVHRLFGFEKHYTNSFTSLLSLEDITEHEQQEIIQIRDDFDDYISSDRVSEGLVKALTTFPLMRFAGFYRRPIKISLEQDIAEISIEDEDTIVRGSIDVLLLLQSFWVVAIEAKRAQYSVEAGLPQLLFYMLNDPSPEQVTFGLLTNGSSFRFIKMTKRDTPQYAVSKLFDIANPGNELYEVFRILKRLAGIISSNASST